MEKQVQPTKKKKMVGGITGKGFDVMGQPSPEAKREGWNRRRRELQIMKKIFGVFDMTVGDYQELRKDIEKNPFDHQMLEDTAVEFVQKLRKNPKYFIAFLAFIVSKAPQAVDLVSDGDSLKNIKITIVDPKNKK